MQSIQDNLYIPQTIENNKILLLMNLVLKRVNAAASSTEINQKDKFKITCTIFAWRMSSIARACERIYRISTSARVKALKNVLIYAINNLKENKYQHASIHVDIPHSIRRWSSIDHGLMLDTRSFPG